MGQVCAALAAAACACASALPISNAAPAAAVTAQRAATPGTLLNDFKNTFKIKRLLKTLGGLKLPPRAPRAIRLHYADTTPPTLLPPSTRRSSCTRKGFVSVAICFCWRVVSRLPQPRWRKITPFVRCG
ncbi:MAG: hypothetical protein FJY56_06340 [Betaproteobacteria bacterium]|nr:hypothetical protein [Betaproteobacteria bacterium]